MNQRGRDIGRRIIRAGLFGFQGCQRIPHNSEHSYEASRVLTPPAGTTETFHTFTQRPLKILFSCPSVNQSDLVDPRPLKFLSFRCTVVRLDSGDFAVFPRFHTALDAAVLAAYGFSPKKDLLQQLLDLNLEVAARIAASQSPPPASRPTSPTPNHSSLNSHFGDCIRPAENP